MNWLAKINFRTVVMRLGSFSSAILLLVILAIVFFCGYRLGNFYHGYQTQTLAQQKARLDFIYQQLAEKTQHINTLEVELEVERMANARSQQTLKLIEQAHFQVKKELAFYEKVMAPEKQANGLVIDGVTLTKSQSPAHYRFQVVLVQQVLRKRYAKGFIELTIIGSLNNKPTSIALSELTTLNKDDLSFSFQYFQIISGELTLPENFVPETINVAAILPKTRWQKYNRIDHSYPWLKSIDNITQSSP
ncbi:hypothetical protein H4J51_08245 [Colwellia sp. MB02u-18]|uniref:DUF6776 family protein n=1 Tax=unclassified Colwellia TaxID=196834 RepID=UPI0015F3C20B|nr:MULTISPECIES: DUF6776 family protein [unclassified Colwellia]MBA6223705.1 hypothetical protein [Colwellia sp. MB3u-45]MBA6268435.1 hypothetical protein [Colwellia sp. MB3u-43]MBA6319886.1 hypothetical protein [Colwellia sp. MB02u-19]MBA6324570.1 hypothetical protein [Colwellia sp. MB02u-18]MBA6330725.1 hypothetical protein [Colwellia sp. MB02u-12]